MDKGRFEAFCTDAMLLIHEVVEYAASPPPERSEAEEDMLRQGRAVARALLVAIDQAAQPRARPPHDPVFARAVQEVREAEGQFERVAVGGTGHGCGEARADR